MIKGLHHNAYRCRDSEETRKFYEDFLGLPLVNAFKIETTQTGRKTGAGVLHSFFQLDDGSCLAFFEAPDMPFEFKDQHDFDLHIALEVEPDALDQMFAKGKAEGREVRGVSDHKFIRSIYFRDPNGYVIELTAKVPGHGTRHGSQAEPCPRHPERLAGEQEARRKRPSDKNDGGNDEAWRMGRVDRPDECCRVLLALRRRRPAAVPGRSVLAQAAAQQLAARPGGERRGRSRRPCLGPAAAALPHRGRERRDARSRRATCAARPAPSVMEFDADGNFIQGWGFPQTKPWVTNEHGIHVDRSGLRLDRRQRRQRQRHLQVHQGRQAGADDRQARARPAAATTPPCSAGRPTSRSTTPRDEVFVADGYGNRRVIVFDSETGAYKRHWGAYGKKPNDDKQPAYDPAAPPSQQFANPVHCAKPSKDGHVYVCDRTNNRIQVFKKDGTFVTEWFYDKSTLGTGAVWDLNFWPDANQT